MGMTDTPDLEKATRDTQANLTERARECVEAFPSDAFDRAHTETLVKEVRAVLQSERDIARAEIAALTEQNDALRQEVVNYNEVLEDKRRIVRDIDVRLNGVGAAKQASLCDLYDQIVSLTEQRDEARAAEADITKGFETVERECREWHRRCNALTEQRDRAMEVLPLIIAQAGIPDPLEACRKIIATCQRALDAEAAAEKGT